jgi:hypothetical protein
MHHQSLIGGRVLVHIRVWKVLKLTVIHWTNVTLELESTMEILDHKFLP